MPMSATPPRVVVTFASLQDLQRDFERNIRKGGAFSHGAGPLPERSECTLVLVHPVADRELTLAAEVVYVREQEPGRGVGVHIRDFGPSTIATLQAFVDGTGSKSLEPSVAATPVPDASILAALAAFLEEPSPPVSPVMEEDIATSEVEPVPADALEESEDSVVAASPEQKLAVTVLQDRIRHLGVAAQLKLAREGGLAERVAIERLFGKAVWEAILQNPRVTPPETARMARMGAAPIPLIEMIASNPSWLSSGEVRRALLSNPRLPEDSVTKVLRSVPKPELQMIAQQPYYPIRIRKAARAILSR